MAARQFGGSRTLIVSPDPGTASEMSRAIGAAMPDAAISVPDAWPETAAAEAFAAASLCFVDISSNPEASFGLLQSVPAEHAGLPTIAVAAAANPDLILQALRAGAAGFLISPFSREELLAVVEKVRPTTRLRAAASAAPGPAGTVYAILPGKGGSGATTIAAGLAFALKRLTHGRVLLADMDGLTGTVGFLLKLRSNYSFLDAVGAASLDADMWKALATPSHGIDVLLAPEHPEDCSASGLDPSPVIASARDTYQIVVLDGGGTTGSWNATLGCIADELLITTTNELPAIQATRRGLAYLTEFGMPPEKPRILLNRYSPRAPVTRDMTETALEREVFATIPDDSEALERALIEGRSPSPATAFGKAISSLARTLANQPAPPRKNASLFSRILAVLG